MTDSDEYPYDPEPTTPIRPYQERTERRAAAQDVEDRFRRRTLWQIVVGGILLLGLIWVAYRQQTVDNDPDPALVAAVDELRTQVRGLGATPAVPPPEDIVDNPPEVVPIPGPVGPTGARGNPGQPGLDGKDGAAGTPGPPGAAGPAGDTGATGETGAAGETGPPGPQGETGPPGPQGDTGSQGAQGSSVSAVRIEQVDGRCLMIVTVFNPLTVTEIDLSPVDIPNDFCRGSLPLEVP